METALNIALIALLLELAASFWIVVHSPIAVVGLSQPFSTDNHTLSSMDFKKAFILSFQQAKLFPSKCGGIRREWPYSMIARAKD